VLFNFSVFTFIISVWFWYHIKIFIILEINMSIKLVPQHWPNWSFVDFWWENVQQSEARDVRILLVKFHQSLATFKKVKYCRVSFYDGVTFWNIWS
jgi:hypothetical protein